MDFAAEPVLDAFTPPPRAASRPAPSGDTGPSFDEHLEAANEAAPEAPASARTEPKSDALSAETKPASTTGVETSEPIDADAALLGGPLPAPPVIAAPLVVQLAVAQPVQTQAQPAEASAPVTAPVTAPPAPAPSAPMMEAAAAAAPAGPVAPSTGKSATSEKSAAAVVPNATQAAVQTQSAPAETATAPTPVLQPAPATAPVAATAQLPAAVQQAIAATLAPAPQVTADIAQRAAKATTQSADIKAAPDANAGAKNATAAPNTNVKTQTAKAVAASAAAAEIASPPQVQGNVGDASQTAQSSAFTATATQTSTHTQHVAADTGAQRAAPAAAQVGREIIRRFDGGTTSFEFRLDPAELGRVEVRMEVSRDHRVTAVISADNPQALTELARHARELEAQLQSAGLQLSDNGLSFDLRQNAGGRDAQDASATSRAGGEEGPTEQQPTQTARPIGFERWRGVRVDMMV